MAMYVNDLCTLPASLAGSPAISVPSGLADGLPVGLQIMAPALADERCFRVGAAFESATTPVLASIPELKPTKSPGTRGDSAGTPEEA
jgi:aspartyl-tRNA(Asn)/glutamyl-tRNA(Gln) amidotransferase subunit A